METALRIAQDTAEESIQAAETRLAVAREENLRVMEELTGLRRSLAETASAAAEQAADLAQRGASMQQQAEVETSLCMLLA